jgi:hypothetical protein
MPQALGTSYCIESFASPVVVFVTQCSADLVKKGEGPALRCKEGCSIWSDSLLLSVVCMRHV